MSCASLNSEFIDITGLCDLDTIDFSKYPFWTQIFIPENLMIPEEKPDIEQIVSVSVGVEIFKTKVIVTPRSGGKDVEDPVPNYEGKLLTGRKLIIEGGLFQTMSYVGAVPEQSVHTAHFIVPFSAYIVLPKIITINGTDIEVEKLKFQVNACVEDVFIKACYARQIFKNVTLLLQAVPVSSITCDDDC